MKNLILICTFLMIARLLLAPESRTFFIEKTKEIKRYEKLWLSICHVESGGNRYAYFMEADGYPSVGIAQIRWQRLKDYNSRTKHHYQMRDLYDPAVSRHIFIYYANQYNDIENICRCWNGGPYGMRYRQTKVYWHNVQKYLNR